MATATEPALLTIEEYLQSSYHPDCDFVRGHLEERNVGEYEHSNLQSALVAWFFNRGPEWNIRVLAEQRTASTPRPFASPTSASFGVMAPSRRYA